MSERYLPSLDGTNEKPQPLLVQPGKKSMLDTWRRRFGLPAVLVTIGGGFISLATWKEEMREGMQSVWRADEGTRCEQDPEGEYRKYCKEKLQETIDNTKKQPFEVQTGTSQRTLMLALGAEDFDQLFENADTAERIGEKNGNTEQVKAAALYRCQAYIILGEQEEEKQPKVAMEYFEKGAKQAFLMLEINPKSKIGAYCLAFFAEKLGRPDAAKLFEQAKAMGNFDGQIADGRRSTHEGIANTSTQNWVICYRLNKHFYFLEKISSPPQPNKK